jgi:hypothetical protein
MPKYKHGSGNIYLRGKTWWITFHVDGQQFWESARTKEKAEARKLLQAKIGQRAEGKLVIGSDKVTFDHLAEGLFNDYKANGRRSLDVARRRINKHLRPFFGQKKAHEISSADVQAFLAHRKDHGASNGEISRELAALKRMFNLAMHAEKLVKRPSIPTLAEDNVR